MKHAGITFKRNDRGGLVAPAPGGYERQWGPPRWLFTDPLFGWPPTIRWADRQDRKRPGRGRRGTG